MRDAVLQAAELVNIDWVDITEIAFGEAMPMTYDSTNWGRDINRRVEVWTRYVRHSNLSAGILSSADFPIIKWSCTVMLRVFAAR